MGRVVRWRWSAWRLGTKIGALLLLSAAVPLGVAETLTYARARAVTAERTEALLTAHAEALVDEIDEFNRFYVATVRRTARLPLVVRALAHRRPVDEQELRGYLDVWPETDDAIVAAHVVDVRGKIVFSSQRAFEGIDISFRPFFQRAAGGEPCISEPFLTIPSALSVAAVAYAAPVLQADGRVVGVAVVLVRANALWHAVRGGNERGGSGSYAVLVDRAGIRLAHSLKDEFVFRPTGPLPPERVEAYVRELRFGARTRALLEAPIASARLMEVATASSPPRAAPFRVVSNVTREPAVVVARRLKTVDWTLFHVVPVATVEEPARRVASAFLVGGLVGLLVIALALVAGRRAVRPAEELAGAVDAVARGESARVRVHGSDELAHLAERFNEMAAAVEGARTELEVRVQQRTEALSAANAELEGQKRELVAQREELERQRLALLTKNEEVERADRLKSQFLANMSHELRTPLNSIIGFSDLLAEQAASRLSAEEAQHLHEVQSSGKHLLNLINEILDLSKIEAGQISLDLGDVAPAVAIADATALVLPAAREKSIDLRAGGADAPPVRADERRVRQILLNLLSNALKFAPRGSAVEVNAVRDGRRVRFSVSDHGPGIEDALRRRLFEPFVQGESPLVKKHQGSGLGLAICLRLVELHGGTMGVDSVPGEGATFYFTLPVGRGEPAGAHGEEVGPVVVLVDEGTAATRELDAWLRVEGFHVVVVTPSIDAWELAARTRPAAIVLDAAAEGRDGFQLLDELKRRKATATIPVVVSSTPSASHFLPKPPDRDELLSVVTDGAGPGGGESPPLVLTIDDDPHVATILRAVLEPAGYRVRSVDRGAAGIEAARAELPALVIVDLVLPDLPGFAVVDALARDPRTRALPVVVLTAADLSASDRDRLKQYARDVVSKGSVTRQQLLQGIRRATSVHAPAANGTALVVDDNQPNRALACAILERSGWRVVLAESGERGLALARSERPTVVVSDLAMPGMDGLTLARALRSDAATAGIPLVALTALAMRGDEERAFAAGFDAYVTKPVVRKALEDAIATALQRSRERGPPA